jgi:hypothetical protein
VVTRPTGIDEETWQAAVRAGFHACCETSQREIAEILAAAVPVLLIPAQLQHNA